MSGNLDAVGGGMEESMQWQEEEEVNENNTLRKQETIDKTLESKQWAESTLQQKSKSTE